MFLNMGVRNAIYTITVICDNMKDSYVRKAEIVQVKDPMY